MILYMKYNGFFCSFVPSSSDPRPTNQRVNKHVNNDVNLRVQNLTILVRHIKNYYQECLQQLVVMNLPNVLLIAKDPLSEKSMDEIKKVLLLMLGCAVQCDGKEEFIEQIKQMDITTQTAIVAHIQEITHNQENVFDLQWMELTEVTAEDLETLSRSMVFHLKRLLDDRDEYSEMIVDLTQDRDYLQMQQLLPSPVNCSSPDCPAGSPNGKLDKGEKQHLAVDLADTKAKLRRIRHELEEKAEQLIDSKHEVERLDSELQRLRQENMQLSTDARSVRAYQDEVDSLREKANRVDRLENELTRCRERLHDVDFYKARMEELREDNMVLIETKNMLEEQLVVARTRCDKLHDLEKENLLLKSKLQDLEMDREADRKRIEELLEENMVLEIEKKQSMNESAHLGWELEQMSRSTDLMGAGHKSFVLEMNESASSRILKLEKDNQSLQHGVQELRQALLTAEGNKTRIAELETENGNLSSKVATLQTELEQEKQSNQDMGNLSEELLRDKTKLKKSMELLQAEQERQVKALGQENEHLNQAITNLRVRSEINAEAKVKEVEKENKSLQQTLAGTSGQLAKLEFDKKQAHKELRQYKEKGERAEALDKDVCRLEHDNEQLQKSVASLKIACQHVEALEQEASTLEVENGALKKSLDSLQNSLVKLESVKKDNQQLDEENVELRRTVETLKFARTKLAKEETERRELERERDELRKVAELLKSSGRKSERLEASYQSLDSENQRLRKTLDNSDAKTQRLEKELRETENENQLLQRDLEELKTSRRRLETLEMDNQSLEHEAARMEKDKAALDKENKRLWQQVELKQAIQEENSLKMSALEKEKRTLEKEVGRYKECTSKLNDLEMDYREVVKQSTINTRTLATLREELCHEKLRSQELSNELEKLNQELEKIGLTKERLLQEEHSSDDNKYKLLETRIESTMKQTLEIKEEKVQALESRLAESSTLNQELRLELSTVKRNMEALLQRQEEENISSQSNSSEKEKWEKENWETTLELLKVKDTVIAVERNNAALQAEKDLLKDQIKQLEAQNSAVNTQILSLQRQAATMQEHTNTLQIQNAKLQVENSTLSSQGASLMGQNASLQRLQSGVERERVELDMQVEELGGRQRALLEDNAQLMQLNERRSAECETLVTQLDRLRAAYNNLDTQHTDLEGRVEGLQREQVEVRDERDGAQREAQRLQTTTEENRQLKDDFSRLQSENSGMREEYERLQGLARDCQSGLNSSDLELGRWKAKYHELKEQHQSLDISQAKMGDHCDLLTQLKSNLEEENHYLLGQVQSLNQQNQTLLERSLESKELYHEEQKLYIDKLHALRRQKEKLEEKIMDQYKFYEPSPKRKNNWVTAKALVKLMKPKKDSAKERLKLSPEAQSRQAEPAQVVTVQAATSPAQRSSLDDSSQGSISLEEHGAATPSKAPREAQKHREMCGASSPSPSVSPSPESTRGCRARRTDLAPLALSTPAIHLIAASHSTPRINARRHPPAKGFNSDDDIWAQPLELEFTKNGNASLGAEDPLDGLSGEDLVPSRDVGAGPRENALYRSSSATLPSARPDPSLVRGSPLPYRTLQRVKQRPAEGRARPASPGSEMVTLEEFLHESGQSAAGASSRDELLSDYFRKKSEPSRISEQPNVNEATTAPAGLVGKTSVDGSAPRPGQFVRPSPRPSRHDSPNASSCGQTLPVHGGSVDAVVLGEKVGQAQRPPCRAGSLTRAISLASADLLRREVQRQETQPRGSAGPPPLGRDGGGGKGGWRSTGDCRAGEQRERPQSARTPALDLSCRTLDPRRLSLAPPKDKTFLLTLPPAASGQAPADRRAGDISPLLPEGHLDPGSGSPTAGNTPRTPEDPATGPSSTPASPDPNTDPQTVWYEYGCV
ncbi:protein Daple [Amblyraja radiata]|uniref:protein Daple n=1 Tax=Amblyraja radiata TaxID=386614 RepID=UPI001402A36A|nr:protein Daple [Amblyraja radiata]